MSVQVMAWVWRSSRAKATARLVLLAIADCANDRGTDAYPSTATLAAKTGLSTRGIRGAIADLENLGELKVEYKRGPNGCNRYRVITSDPAGDATSDPAPGATSDTRQEMHSAPDATSTRHHVPGTRQDVPGHPAPRADKPSSNHPPTEPSVEPSVARTRATADRGTRLPDDFAPTVDMIAWAKEQTPLVGTKETAAFVDYWHSQPGAKGRKTDWLATWRNWMRRAQNEAEARRSRSNGRASPELVNVNGLKLTAQTAQRMTTDRQRLAAMDERQAIEGPS